MSSVTAEAPGRVNIIGEHIDYCGYSVLPYAIPQNIVVHCRIIHPLDALSNDQLQINCRNKNSTFPECSLNPRDRISQLQLQPQDISWTDYVLCGYYAATSMLSPLQPTTLQRRMEITVSGNIPSGQGLSSSSALVVASAIAFGVAMGITATAKDIARACIEAEKLVGTIGGGMDQSISCLAQDGMAMRICCRPELTTELIRLPEEAVFILCSSMVIAKKAQETKLSFNTRVVECRLAAIILTVAFGKTLKLDQANTLTLSEFAELYCMEQPQHEFDHSSSHGDDQKCDHEVESIEICNLQRVLSFTTATLREDSYSPDLIRSALMSAGIAVDLLFTSPATAQVWRSTQQFRLRDRAVHVFSEALRVALFCKECRRLSCLTPEPPAFDRAPLTSVSSIDPSSPPSFSIFNTVDSSHSPPPLTGSGDCTSHSLTGLGQLMNASHASLRDLYECSCAELDELTSASLALGAVGARLTGAGWGGMVLALVHASQVERFCRDLWEQHYVIKLGLDPATDRSDILFVTRPSAGARVVKEEVEKEVRESSSEIDRRVDTGAREQEGHCGEAVAADCES